MPREIKAERYFFLAQKHPAIPRCGLDHGGTRLRRFARPAKQADLLRIAFVLFGRPQRNTNRSQQARTVSVNRIESTGAYQRLDDAPVDQPFVDAFAKIKEIAEGAVLGTRGNHGIDRRFAGALDRTETITQRLHINRHKTIFAAVDIGGQYLQLVGKAVFIEHLHLVGVIHGGRHVGRHEGGRMMRLEVGRVIGHQRISGGVRLVKAIAGELLHQVEEFVGLGLLQSVFASPLAEDAAMLGHLLGLFLAHRTPQQIGAAERVTADDLRHLHDLFLIDHDAVGLGQNRLDTRLRIIKALAVFARDVIRNQIHRPRSIQRDQGDNVFKTVGPRLLQHVAHAARFKLEHRRGIGAGKNPVGRDVIERQQFERRVVGRIEALDVTQRPVEDGEGGQAQEVELDQARRFDVVLVELADRRR